jgi:outer membrane protein W
MKQFLLLATLSLGALTAHAQKGSFYIGGQAGFNSRDTEVDNRGNTVTTSKSSNYAFSPEIGTFLSNQVQLGVGFTFSGSRREIPGTSFSPAYNTKINRYGGTVYSRYFFGEGVFRPFIGLNASVLPGNSTSDSTSTRTLVRANTLDIGANLNVGFGYGLTKRVTLVGSFGTFGFLRSTSKQEGNDIKTTTNNFGLNANTLGNLFNVGLYFTFISGENQEGGK